MEYFSGDITNTHLEFIVHGCNDKGVFNKGVAKAIRQAFPNAYTQYISEYKTKALGQAIIAHDERGYVIGNLLTQSGYGLIGQYAQVEWIYDALVDFIESTFATVIASPKIGCGLGGLTWEEVEPIYCEIEDKYNVVFVIYTL
jgi:O-acetyl-ADP-ribose deacetylase (regulator of RNase III)